MALPGLILVHGGGHAANCWDLTIAELARLAPELRVLAVDLPGRGAKPADLAKVSITDWVDSVIADVESSGLNEVVVAGHSLAGVTVPGVVARLGAKRVREMILLAAFIPPQGFSVATSVSGRLTPLARLAARIPIGFPVYWLVARFAFCNGMTREQRKYALSRVCPESRNVFIEPVQRSDLPDQVPRTWIMTLHDRTLSARQQHRCMTALGGVDTIICADTCHDMMISDPKQLAAILLGRCRFRAKGH
jgi:pimeloyl-ACP methyl ester carboxylesterase